MAHEQRFVVESDWLTAAHEQPDLAQPLDTYDITGDESFLAARSRMPSAIVTRLDSLRFRFSCGGEPCSEGDWALELEHFKGAPPEVLALAINKLPFSVRTRTRLKAAGLTTIGEVVEFGTLKLLSVQGAGRKALEETYLAFRRVTQRFLITRIVLRPAGRLATEVRRWLGTLDDRTRRIASARLELGTELKTLEMLGAELGLTRERVRQIEAKAVKREIEAEAWPQYLAGRVGALITGSEEPVYLALLSFFDSFFDDFDYGVRALARVLETFAPDVAQTLEINGSLVLARVSEGEFAELRAAVLEVARDCVRRRSSQTEYVVAVESLCLSRNAREFAQLLIAASGPYVHAARPPGSAEPILVAFGRGVDHIVRAVMEEAESPLHYSEVHRRVVQRAEPDIELRRVHAALDADCYYLFARGTYGLWRHLEITESRSATIVQAAEEVVARANRQWHAGEVLAALRDESPDLVGDLDFHRINALLTKSKSLRYLGRMVWVGSSSSERDSSDRIDIAQACTRLLREAGRPLSRIEILERLKDWRGIGRHFQIHFSEDVFPVAPGIFGLRSRDLPVTSDQLQQMIDCVAAALSHRQMGLHVSELAPVFSCARLDFASKVSGSTLLAFAARDARLQVDPGDYIGLADWEGTRRYSITAAGRYLADQGISPVTVDAFLERMASLVGRSLSRMDATVALRDNGYTYDQEARVWVLPAEESADTYTQVFQERTQN